MPVRYQVESISWDSIDAPELPPALVTLQTRYNVLPVPGKNIGLPCLHPLTETIQVISPLTTLSRESSNCEEPSKDTIEDDPAPLKVPGIDETIDDAVESTQNDSYEIKSTI